jgi:cytochrome c556
MNRILSAASVAAVVLAAACNSGGGGENASAPPAEEPKQAATNVASGAATPADHKAVMHARHEHYEAMGKAMKGVSDQLKARSPSISDIQRHAALMAGYGPQMLSWFPEGSGPEAGRTRAKAEIWSDAATFRAAAERFGQASAEFNRAAQSGDVEAVKAAMPALGSSCKNCHDRFRGPDDH